MLGIIIGDHLKIPSLNPLLKLWHVCYIRINHTSRMQWYATPEDNQISSWSAYPFIRTYEYGLEYRSDKPQDEEIQEMDIVQS